MASKTKQVNLEQVARRYVQRLREQQQISLGDKRRTAAGWELSMLPINRRTGKGNTLKLHTALGTLVVTVTTEPK